MNAVEIESAVSDLAAEPFDAVEFPFQFLAAFDKKETTLKRLRKGDSNKSDVPGGVLLQANIHLAVCPAGDTRATLERLKASPKTFAAKAKFVLATDGVVLEAEDLTSGEAIAPDYPRFAEHIGFFLPLAGISTVREIKDNPIDVRATGRLNKLYVELLRQNPEWGTEARRHDMNHFMARLIFCFFAEDTDIFFHRGRFTSTVEQFSESDGSNTHQVLRAIFSAMNTKIADRQASGVPGYADVFPYVNGGLFAGSTEVPQFTRIARSYLLQAGSLDWQHINPDIFGSMIQAVADDAERGALGMHYTSVPNILKVLNPLFLDELRAQLEAAGDNSRMLLNLRRRLSRIRVFDPACGSGNFLVIAYKEMRKIEAAINLRRDESLRRSEISKKSFRGIEIRDFAAEIARLALVIAEYQCDVLHRGPLAAKAEFLPLDEMNWITCGNALRLDWLQVCPPEGTGVKLRSNDLFQTPLEQPEIDFENEGGETYICGNPPYSGKGKKSKEEISDMHAVFSKYRVKHGYMDFVSAWFMRAAEYGLAANATSAFVTTNSICQGHQVPLLWPSIFATGHIISFAHTSFQWANLASHNAVVTVAIIGLSRNLEVRRHLTSLLDDGKLQTKVVNNINAYLIGSVDALIEKRSIPFSGLASMDLGNMACDGGNLLLSRSELTAMQLSTRDENRFVRRIYGSKEFIDNRLRFCLWIEDETLSEALTIPAIRDRIASVKELRLKSPDPAAKEMAKRSHQFREMRSARVLSLIVPRHSSENRPFLPVGLLEGASAVQDSAFAIYDAPIWNMAVIASRLHLVWISTTCGKIKTDYRYSKTIGWNTFPIPSLTEQNKTDLTRCAEDILLAREAHFPATIADLYDPEDMPANLRAAHEANDETLERIYIGRRFKNDTERLEKLFEMYAKMTDKQGEGNRTNATATKRRAKAGMAAEVQA
jgi:hypothetical protein